MIELYPYSCLLIESDSWPICPTTHTDLICETDKPDGTELPVLSLEGTDTMGLEEMAAFAAFKARRPVDEETRVARPVILFGERNRRD